MCLSICFFYFFSIFTNLIHLAKHYIVFYSFQVIIIYYNGIIYIYILYIDIMPLTENIPTATRMPGPAASGKENAPPKLAASVTGNTAAAGTANIIRSLPRRSRSQRRGRGRGRSQRRGRGRSQRRGRGRSQRRGRN